MSGTELISGLLNPRGIFLAPDDGRVFVVDQGNHRVISWKENEGIVRAVAGGNGAGNGLNQLNSPCDVLLDKQTNSLLISDLANRRVIRWSLEPNIKQGEIIIQNMSCMGMAMDDEGALYVSNPEKHEVRRFAQGDRTGVIVAGGNGQGAGLNQLNNPYFITVNRDGSLYVSDYSNGRVIKWNEGADEGIVVVGGQGTGLNNTHTRLSNPQGIAVDTNDTLYVVEQGSRRITRWRADQKTCEVVVAENQIFCPQCFSFDQNNNLYVTGHNNRSVLRFSIQ